MSNKKIEFPIDPERIIPIDPDSKYFVVMPVGTTNEQLRMTVLSLDAFMNSSRTFFVVQGDIAVIRIEDGETEVLYSPQEIAETSSCAREEIRRGSEDSAMQSASQDMQE